MAKVLPLDDKYYGTKIQIKNPTCPNETEEIKVWFPDHFAHPFASEREIAKGWTPEDGQDHVEDAQSYKIACIIAKALTEAGY